MIRLTDLHFHYGEKGFSLRIPKLKLPEKKSVALVGPSGCGKTTLLYLLSGICRPQSGRVLIGDVDLGSLPEEERRRFRSARIGFVFQEFELLEYLTVRQNILLQHLLGKKADNDAGTRLGQLARDMGVENLLGRYPKQLSQGEKQRAAICRALIHRPAYVIADEPTGNLDPAQTQVILKLLLDQARDSGATLIMVTHDHSLLPHFDEVIDLGAYAGKAST